MGIQVKPTIIRTLYGILLLSLAFSTAVARDYLPVSDGSVSDTRQVFVLQEKGELIGVSWTGQMCVVRLKTSERVIRGFARKTIAIYVTSERYLGYSGRRNNWYSVSRDVAETLSDLQVGDQNGVVLTNKRVLSFNGDRWTEMHRRTIR